MVVFIIVLIVLILGVIVVGITTGLFRIEKVEVDEPGKEYAFPDEDELGEKYELDDDDGLTINLDDDEPLKEKMELDGYFDEEGAAAEEQAEAEEEAAPFENEDRFAQADRLSSFKAGRSYLIECQKELFKAKKERQVYAAIYFDVDRFRFTNSLKGMTIGDFVLTRISHDLPAILPESAKITRISADHFAAVFPVSDAAMFEEINDGIKTLCEKARIDVALKGSLNTCMGIATTENAERDYDISVLIHKANIARHCIKYSRTETIKMYEDSMLTTYLYGESALDDYSENQYDDEFVIYYTPQEDITMRKIVGCDTLVRWNCEEEAGIPFPYGASKSKIPSNGTKILYQVCKAMSRWRKAGKRIIPVSVSISPLDLFKSDIDAFLAKVLSEFQLEPGLLSIVIDAPMLRLNGEAIARQIKRIRDMGVTVGVDEIDTGYHNLDFLSGLPVNFIKLNQAFIVGLAKNEERREKARSMINMASGQQLAVVFEGVDDKETARILHGLGAKDIQGSYCGKPRKSDEFAQGLPENVVARKSASNTVILDDSALSKGDFKIF